MDVGCPKCQTEYELDDARVPEDGVTVKCTTCGHVFRVKKKSLVVTLPVREGEAAVRQAQAAGELPPAPPSREWKIRQPGGNLFSCRELTTLQKWIIEGKVGRDDEISLTGDTWKRLGNIPELASFFQVFDEAKKARALDALGTVPPTAPGAGPKITDTWREPHFAAPPPMPMPARPEPAVSAPPPNIRETMREPQFSVPPPPPLASVQPPPPPPP
ncbi:MAG: zinc-ribbon domain-containing protein, partial [Myxococcota bacterium]